MKNKLICIVFAGKVEFTVMIRLTGKQIAQTYGFMDTKYAFLYRVRPFSPKVYIRLLVTLTDYIEIEESIRNEFFKKIEEVIENMVAKS